MDQAGNAFAWWTTQEAGYSSQLAFRPAGGSFGTPFTPDGSSPVERIDLDLDAAGNAIVAWTVNSELRIARRSAGPGGSFGPAQVIQENAQAFDVEVNRDGDALLVWNKRVSFSSSDVRVAFRPAGENTSFASPQTLQSDAWAEHSTVLDPRPGPSALVLLRKSDGSTVQRLAPDASASPSTWESRTLPGDLRTPYVSSNAAGRAAAVWYAAPWSLIHTSVREPRGFFTHAATRQSDESHEIHEARTAVGALGNAVVVWSDRAPGSLTDTCNPPHYRIGVAEAPSSGSFGASRFVFEDGHYLLSPGGAVAPDGAVLTAWHRDECGRAHRAVVSFRGEEHTFAASQYPGQFAAAFDGPGGAVLAWSNSGSGPIEGAFYSPPQSGPPPGTSEQPSAPGESGGVLGGRRRGARPLITITGVPRRCAQRSIFLRVRLRDPDSPLARVVAYIDGKRFATTRRLRFSLRLPRGLRPGRHRLRLVVIDADGNRSVKTVRLRVCRQR